MKIGLYGSAGYFGGLWVNENFMLRELAYPRVQLFVQNRIHFLGKSIFN